MAEEVVAKCLNQRAGSAKVRLTIIRGVVFSPYGKGSWGKMGIVLFEKVYIIVAGMGG